MKTARLFVLLTCLTSSLGAADPTENADATAAIGVIETMNHAVTARDLQALIDTFADGAIRLDLFAAHSFDQPAEAAPNEIKAVDLKTRWQTVAPILFSGTRSYRREVSEKVLHIDQDMAVAWATIDTETRMHTPVASSTSNRFREVYILRRGESGWKIVAITNNRRDVAR